MAIRFIDIDQGGANAPPSPLSRVKQPMPIEEVLAGYRHLQLSYCLGSWAKRRFLRTYYFEAIHPLLIPVVMENGLKAFFSDRRDNWQAIANKNGRSINWVYGALEGLRGMESYDMRDVPANEREQVQEALLYSRSLKTALENSDIPRWRRE